MNISTKILAVIATVVFLGLCGVILYEVHAVHVRQDAIEQQVVQQKQLADGITRAMASWATKADLDQLAKDSNINLADIKRDLATLNANVAAINVSSATSTGQVANNLPSTNTTPGPHPVTPPNTVTCDGKQIPCPNADPYGYQANTQQFALNEEFGTLKVPFGTVGFTASQPAPWSINIAPRKYNSVTVIGTDENQRMYAYNKFTIHVDNKDYDVPVTTSQIKQEYPMPKFTLFNPRLYLGFDAGVNVNQVQANVGPNLNIQIASFGKYKNQPDLSILQIGAGYDITARSPNLVIRPVSYNIGQHIPLMHNLYVGPALQVNTQGNVSATLGLTVGL